jgi:two-component system, chemotaxis family, response regulator Rcp1
VLSVAEERRSVSTTRFHIVLVEDAEPDVFLVREALERNGLEFELEVLDDGEKAVDFIERLEQDPAARRPHLVLLDLNLPKKSGGQVLERVRKSAVCGDVPVVILTSSDSPVDKASAARFRATEFFKKPSKWDEFMRLGPLVRNLLGAGEH